MHRLIVIFFFFSFTSVGDRAFDVNVEGSVLSDIDIVQQCGGVPNKAITREARFIVADGFLIFWRKYHSDKTQQYQPLK